MSRWRVGVDSGGTFTDVCLFDEETGRVEVWKVPPRPTIRRAASRRRGGGHAPRRPDAATAGGLGYFGHGTTVATNALIQHAASAPASITTDGFRDLLEIGRQKRPDLYDIQADKPPVLVPATCGWRCRSACATTARSRRRWTRTPSARAARALRAAGVQAVAVCFLYGFVRTAHEQRAAAILPEEFPEAFICPHEVAPEFREFERLSTAVVNAYLGPVMQGYIRRLGPRLAALGMRRRRT